MEITKKKITLKVYGEEIELRAPTALEAAEFADSVNEKAGLSTVDMIKKTQEFLASVGLPSKICLELELEHLQQIVEFITKKK